MNTLYMQQRQRLLPWLALLVLTTAIGYRQVAAQLAAPANLVVAGSYAGTVLVTEPTLLGDLDLLLEITNANGQLTGQVNPIKTQVFLGGPTFTGSVTTNGVITPTVRIESQTFSGEVSGRTVQRHFVLTGEVVNNGDTLRGEYAETIVGFKPHPMLIKGRFLLVRPAGVTAVVTVPTPQGGTPIPTPTRPGSGGAVTPTATATVPPVNGNGPKLFLPLVQRGAKVNAAAVEEPMMESAPTVAPTETPTPTATETPAPTTTETPTPTPLVLGASPALTTTTEMQQQIHLPLVIQ